MTANLAFHPSWGKKRVVRLWLTIILGIREKNISYYVGSVIRAETSFQSPIRKNAVTSIIFANEWL